MQRTQGKLGQTFHTLMFFRSKLSVLGIFLRINATRFVQNFSQEVVRSGKNRQRKRRRKPQIYSGSKKSSENSKSNRNDSPAEKTARE